MLKNIGKYEVVTEIGQGAMGVVYKARDPLIGRMVALKTITSGLSGKPELLERFYQEARSAGALQHPNIVTIFELGKEGDTPFIAMEFLEGDSLEKIVARIPTGRLGQAEEIARTVLFLVAEESGFITGSTLSVNGGQHMY